MKDPIPQLLNTVQALIEAGVDKRVPSYRRLATELGLNYDTMRGWFGADRRFRPDGAGAVLLKDWAVRTTRKLSRLGETTPRGRELHSRYRAAYQQLCQRFPVDGTAA